MKLPYESDDPSVRYVVGSLIAGVFFGGVGGGVAFPTIPTLGTVLGISPLLVGIILSINRFTRLLMNTPAGQILDRVGTRRPMIIGFVVQGLVPFGYVLGLHAHEFGLPNAMVFLFSRATWGIGSAFVFVGAFSTVTQITTEQNRGKWVGYMRGGQSLGFPTGLVLGGILTAVYGYDVAFIVAGVTASFAAVVAFFVLPDTQADVSTVSGLRELPNLVTDDLRIFTVGAVNFVVRFLFAGILLSTVVLYARENGITVSWLSETGVSGVVMAVSVLFSSLTTIGVGRVSDTLSNRAALTIPSLTCFAAGFAVLALLPTTLGAVVGVALVGIGVGGTNPPLLAYLGDISPKEDLGKLGGVYNVFGDLGSTVGPLVALPVAARTSVATEYLGSVGLIALTATLVAVTLFERGPLAPQTVPRREDGD
ncbi:MAG: MFS transporter [Haloferacaceae archaeon]